jgi:hypothetical protein
LPDVSREAQSAEEELVADEVFGDGDGLVADTLCAGHAVSNLRGMVEGINPISGTTWTVKGLLLCLRFAMWLKPSSDMRFALADAARMFFGEHGESLAGMLETGVVALPSIKCMRRARLRLDMCSMLFESCLHQDFVFLRYVMPDSSPQLGRNFLCVREDRIKLPRAVMHDADARSKLDLNSCFETRIMPLTTLGSGHESHFKKATNVAGLYLNESSDLDQFDEKRCGVMGLTSDQGAEMQIADASVHVVNGYADRYPIGDAKFFLWPRCLLVVGHLHVLFNALEEACKSLDVSDWFFNCLRTLCNFLSDQQLRRRFQSSCLKGKACYAQFTHFVRIHIDWRWETLGPALEAVSKLMPHLAQYFNLEAMLKSETCQSSSGELRSVADVVAQCEMVMLVGEMFKCVSRVVERCASKLESCLCHEHIWKNKRGHAEREKEVSQTTGFNHCVWKGRLASWWVAEGLAAFLLELSTATSDAFEAMLITVPEARRANVLTYIEQLRATIVEIISLKSNFWHHIPWKLIGVFYCCLGGTIQRSKDILRECLDEYNAIVAAGKAKFLHRVAVRLLDPDRAVGIELRRWLESDLPLIAFVNAYCALLEYALISMVERRVESIHAIIKRIGASTPNVSPPICVL